MAAHGGQMRRTASAFLYQPPDRIAVRSLQMLSATVRLATRSVLHRIRGLLWTSCKLLQNSHRDHQKRSKLNFITRYPPGSSRTWTNSSKLSQCSCYWQEATPTLLRLLNQDQH
ncbi:hypothetical protein L209DRAFT_802852 [Thermothelomyces heterothallicus CBS 203.75]